MRHERTIGAPLPERLAATLPAKQRKEHAALAGRIEQAAHEIAWLRNAIDERPVERASVVVGIPICPVVGSTSTHGNHWSPAPESTCIGPLHEVPPFDDTIWKTSVFVTGLAESWIPFRLWLKTR